jgi:hypothetical protein
VPLYSLFDKKSNKYLWFHSRECGEYSKENDEVVALQPSKGFKPFEGSANRKKAKQ